MSYEPTVWQSGDIVTAEKLNKLENGVAGSGGGAGSGVMIVDVEFGEPEEEGDQPPSTLNKTWQEIYDAMAAGVPVFMRFVAPEGANSVGVTLHLIGSAVYNGTSYMIEIAMVNMAYSTSTADGYPANSGSGK